MIGLEKWAKLISYCVLAIEKNCNKTFTFISDLSLANKYDTINILNRIRSQVNASDPIHTLNDIKKTI